MAGKFLMDTNIVIAMIDGNPNVIQQFHAAAAVSTATIVIGELYFGAHHSGRVEANIQRIDEFAASLPVLECDLGTAQQYGLIKNALRAKGRPIPDNDIWIAALALQHSLILVSRDAHFNEVDGLTVAVW